MRTKLSEADPLNDTAKAQLAAALGSLGDMLLFMGDAAAAEDVYSRGLAIYSQLAAADSRPATQRALGLAHYRFATALLRQHKSAAAGHYQKCLDIHEELAGKGGSKIELMFALARCGKFERAAAIADEVRTARPPRARLLYYAAACYALCCADPMPSATADHVSSEKTRRASYGEKAVSTLCDAIRAGYRDAVELGVDPDFDYVRDLPEFQAILNELRDAQQESASPARP